MNIVPFEMYHIYNQGNNREKIFYDKSDYIEFFRAVKKYILPCCHITAYCLMPNHFHFQVYSQRKSAEKIRLGDIHPCRLSNGFRLLQSQYAQYFNEKYSRTGSLFRQKAKAKSLDYGKENYRLIAFNYIHQNPVKHGLVRHMADWPFSSFGEYFGNSSRNLCNKKLAMTLIDIDPQDLLMHTYQAIDESLIRPIFSRVNRTRFFKA